MPKMHDNMPPIYPKRLSNPLEQSTIWLSKQTKTNAIVVQVVCVKMLPDSTICYSSPPCISPSRSPNWPFRSKLSTKQSLWTIMWHFILRISSPVWEQVLHFYYAKTSRLVMGGRLDAVNSVHPFLWCLLVCSTIQSTTSSRRIQHATSHSPILWVMKILFI